MRKKRHITNGAFQSVKRSCLFCRRPIRFYEIFCGVKCGEAYFKKKIKGRNLRKKKINEYDGKKIKQHFYTVEQIISKEEMVELIKEVENNIKEHMRKRD